MSACPSLQQLSEFNSGLILDADEIDRIAEHLGSCESCLKELDRMAPDSLAAGLKEAQSSKYDLVNQVEAVSSESFSMAMSKVSGGQLWLATESNSMGDNRYQIVATIDEGLFGYSFLGRIENNELFRITIPYADKLASKQHFDQFERDCEAAQTLQHPNIQTPVEFGFWDNSRFYYAVEYLTLCPTLATLTKTVFGNEGLSWNCAVKIFRQIIDAIEYAHGKNIWHRSLSPENIWICDYKRDLAVLIGNFGFSLDSRYQFGLLEAAENVNTFMSPESINNDAEYIDQRSDIYSMGRILKLLAKVSQGMDNATSKRIDQFVLKSTEPRRSERFQSMAEFKDAWIQAAGDID